MVACALRNVVRDKPDLNLGAPEGRGCPSGDFAFSWGKGKLITKDKKGKVTETTAKYVSVWKKQADENWKIAVDTMIPDPPEKKKQAVPQFGFIGPG